MFAVGDKVVHPLHGAGVIEAIVEERIRAQTATYYVFRLPGGGLTLKIPTENSVGVGLRELTGEAEMDALLGEIPAMDPDMTNNWNRRYRENMERLKSGDLREVACVIKGLVCREMQHGLSTGERKMLINAKQSLLSEVALVKHMTIEAADALLLEQIVAK